MTSLPSLTGKELLSILKKAGFEVLRVKGSHHIFFSTRMAAQQSYRFIPVKP
jgi:predicted RNA binding protein YcfA (HicA-like mRNA interferase family)